MGKPTQPTSKILFLDVETAPILASVWGIWQVNVPLNMIEHDWHLLSFAAKWIGEKEVIYYDQSKARNVENDKLLLRKLWKLLNQADFVVAQNGRRFDIPKINARLITQGFKPPSPYKVIDTKDMAKRNFAFTSNRLEHLTRLLCKEKKSLHKLFPGFLLWQECLKGNQAAWKELKTYNIQDIRTLEELYLKLRPWSSVHPNLAVSKEAEFPECPRCGDARVIRNGYSTTAVGKYQRYQCAGCGGYARGSKLVNTAEQRKALLRVI
jgi:predicted RNA-binding Zn-ribbon protein involved in translation (DUF1610 family)